MSVQQPKVTIGLPVFNGQEFIVDAIESVLQQTYPDYELVISDNASSDNTQKICEKYASQDPRIRYHRQPVNKGAGWNFNQVFQLATGEYFKWLAADDRIAPQFLGSCVEVLNSDPGVVLCYTRTAIIDQDGNTISEYDVHLNTDSHNAYQRFSDLVLEWSLCFEVFGLIRSSALNTTGGMGNFSHGDGVLLAQLGIIGRFQEIEALLNFSRKHARQSMRMFGTSESGGNDYHRYAMWFNPGLTDKLIFPNWKIFWEFYKSIWKFPLGWVDKLKSHFVMVIWIRRHIRHLLNDLIIGAKFILRSKKK